MNLRPRVLTAILENIDEAASAYNLKILIAAVITRTKVVNNVMAACTIYFS